MSYRRSDFLLWLLPLIVAIVYSRTFVGLARIWWNDTEYSHGFLILPVAIYIAWTQRHRLRDLPPRPEILAAACFLGVSVILLWAGRAGGFLLAEGISFLLLVPGIVLFLWGRTHLKILALPICYLQFMVPWMEEFIDRIHWPFQILSANIGVILMKASGLAVYLDGQFIEIPGMVLDVARECSGVAFLTSVIALGIPLVYFTQRSWLRAIIVILSGVVITLLTNGLRVALVGCMTSRYGIGVSHGPFHIFQGWFVAQVGFAALLLINWGVTRLPSSARDTLCNKVGRTNSGPVSGEGTRSPSWALLIVILASLSVGGIYLHFFGQPVPVSLKEPLSGFPSEVGDWKGAPSAWIQGEKYFPGVDQEASWTFTDGSGKKIHLYVGYFERQGQGKSLVNFRANPLREGGEAVHAGFGPRGPVRVFHSYPLVGSERYEVVCWYRLATGDLSGRYETKIRSITNAMINRRNNGAVILLATAVSENRTDRSRISSELVSLASSILPALRASLP